MGSQFFELSVTTTLPQFAPSTTVVKTDKIKVTIKLIPSDLSALTGEVNLIIPGSKWSFNFNNLIASNGVAFTTSQITIGEAESFLVYDTKLLVLQLKAKNLLTDPKVLELIKQGLNPVKIKLTDSLGETSDYTVNFNVNVLKVPETPAPKVDEKPVAKPVKEEKPEEKAPEVEEEKIPEESLEEEIPEELLEETNELLAEIEGESLPEGVDAAAIGDAIANFPGLLDFFKEFANMNKQTKTEDT